MRPVFVTSEPLSRPEPDEQQAPTMDAIRAQAELIELDIHKCYCCRNRVTSQVLNLIRMIRQADV